MIRLDRIASRVSIALIIVAATVFAGGSGVFVRDFGAGFGTSVVGASTDPGSGLEEVTTLYQLTYEFAVFSTVEVRITIQAVYATQRFEARSNGSFLTSFRPELPGLYHFLVVNIANVTGQLGYSIVLRADVPPELETAMLDPLLFAAAGFLVASVGLSVASRLLLGRSKEEGNP